MSENLYEESANATEDTSSSSFLGESYAYYKNIRTPLEIGMSDKGTLKQLGNNVDGLIAYTEVLITGKGKASATGKPLGNKFFLKTGGKCSATSAGANGEETPRYIYIDNVPSGNIPFLSSASGVNFTSMRGLIPGTISNLNAFNPVGLFRAFLAGPVPECQEITMETIDTYNNRSTESHFVSLADIKMITACQFPGKVNPVTNVKCRETFTNMGKSNRLNANTYSCVDHHFKIPNDPIVQAYFASLGVFGIYLMYRLMVKTKLVPELV
jgi:hypothetical protein